MVSFVRNDAAKLLPEMSCLVYLRSVWTVPIVICRTSHFRPRITPGVISGMESLYVPEPLIQNVLSVDNYKYACLALCSEG